VHERGVSFLRPLSSPLPDNHSITEVPPCSHMSHLRPCNSYHNFLEQRWTCDPGQTIKTLGMWNGDWRPMNHPLYINGHVICGYYLPHEMTKSKE
jgi:hypothetical protein